MSAKVKRLKKTLSLPETFGEAHCDIKDELCDRIFLLKNGDLGVVYSLSGIYDDPMTHGELECEFGEIFKFLRQLCLGIPGSFDLENIAIQLICSQREDKPFNPYVGKTSLSAVILKEEQDFLEDKIFLKRRFYLCVRFLQVKKKASLIEKMTHTLSVFSKAYNKDYKDLLEERRSLFHKTLLPLEECLKAKRALKRLGRSDVISYVQNILFGARDVAPVYKSGHVFEDVINPPLTSYDDRLESDECCLQPFVMTHSPEEFSLGLMKNFLESLPIADFDCVFCLTHGSSTVENGVNFKLMWFENGKGHARKIENLNEYKNNVSSLGPRGKLSVRLLTYNLEKEKFPVLQTLAQDFLGARLVPEEQIAIHMIASSLPLGLTRIGNDIKGRVKSMRLEAALGFLPIFSGPPHNENGRVWRSRLGTPTSFDLFKGSGNRMTAILGVSGGGKSCLMNQLLLEYKEKYETSLIRIIDKKTSYQKFCDVFGGKVVTFSEESLKDDPFSPFALEAWDSDDIINICVILKSAILQTNKEAQFSSLHHEILLDAIKLAFNNHAHNKDYAKLKKKYDVDPHPTFLDVLANLPTCAKNKAVKGALLASDEIAKWSVSLQETGQYGFLFCRHEIKKDRQSSLLVYDLDGIPDPILRFLAAQIAFLKTAREMSKAPKAMKKLIVMEELGMFLLGDDEKLEKLNTEFIQNTIKTCRKLNAQAITLTNELSDYLHKAAGKTVWNTATQKIFLPLSKSIVEDMKAEVKKEFTEGEFEILEILNISKSLKRTQAYVSSQTRDHSYKGVVDIFLSPFLDALVSTDGPMLSYYESKKKDGKEPLLILKDMAKKYPYGDGIEGGMS